TVYHGTMYTSHSQIEKQPAKWHEQHSPAKRTLPTKTLGKPVLWPESIADSEH
ncbi:unnamed protein product, partial [marine sediment metagenome]